jgi:hypothetical protein
MAMSRRQPALKVEIPTPGSTPMRLGKVGLIALVGFGIGIAWPRLAGVRLVPQLPAAPAASQDLSGAPDEPPAASAVASARAPAPGLPPPVDTSTPGIQPPVVGEMQVTSCRDAGGGRIQTCDAVDFDRVARARLSSLDGCEVARRVSGVVSLGFELDFTSERVTKVTSGKTSSIDETALKALLDCYRQSFANVSLVGIPHQHQRYSVFYRVELKAPLDETAAPAGSEAPPASITPASGMATVSWDTALVRNAPDRDSKVVARVLSGTRVGVTGRSGDWYRVKYDAKGREGWVFRTSIGM